MLFHLHPPSPSTLEIVQASAAFVKSISRILIVDDTPDKLRLLMKILTERGYSVYPAPDGELALQFVQSTLPDSSCLTSCVPHGSETILLVEDNQEVRKLIQRVLSNQHYTVLEASNGEEALQIAQAYPDSIDLVVTDVIMPGGT